MASCSPVTPAPPATTFHVIDRSGAPLPEVTVCRDHDCGQTDANGDVTLTLPLNVQLFIIFRPVGQPSFGGFYTVTGSTIGVILPIQ